MRTLIAAAMTIGFISLIVWLVFLTGSMFPLLLIPIADEAL